MAPSSMTEPENWRPWIRPMVKRRRRSFAQLRLWRDQYLFHLWSGHGYGNRRWRHKPRGLRIWKSARYPDARRAPPNSENPRKAPQC